MNAWSMVKLVTGREIRERALKKGYLIGTAVTLLIVTAAVAIPGLLASDGPSEVDLGVVGEAPDDLEAQLVQALGDGYDVTVVTVTDRDTAAVAVEDDELDLALVDARELLSDGNPDPAVRAALDGLLQVGALADNLAAAGLDDEAASAVLQAPEPLQVVQVSGDDAGGVFLVAFAATFLLFIGVQMSGATLLSGALEEKSNRVVEVLVSTARPWHLLTGKVLATSVLSGMQIVLMVAVALGTNAAVGAFELPDATGSVLAVSAIMLVAGFLFYAALFTVAGTLAVTMEDAQSTAGPLSMVMIGSYIAVFVAVIPSPSGIVSQVLSFLPPTAPFVVPARVALSEMATWQIPLSIGLTLLGAIVTLRIAGRIYAASLLSGGRLTWSAAWKAEPIR